MVAIRNNPSARSDTEWRAQKPWKNLKPLKNFSGFIFVCSNETIPDVERKIFGLPAYYGDSVRAIKRGMPLFLYNYSTRCLCGVYEAASDGGFNLDPHAWENYEAHRRPTSRYPAQVKVRLRFARNPLSEEVFRPILDHFDGQKFRLELTAYQVQRLLRLFQVPEKEFFPQTTQRRSYIGTNVFLESPRSSNRSDSDCCSERSSKGSCYCEDDSPNESRIEEVLVTENPQPCPPRQCDEQLLGNMIVNLSLNDQQVNCEKQPQQFMGADLHYSRILPLRHGLDGSNLINTNWMAPVNPSCFSCVKIIDPTSDIQLLARLQDADTSSDINVVAFPPQPPVGEGDDSVVAPPEPQLHASFSAFPKVFYIPVRRQSLEFAHLHNLKDGELHTSSQNLELNGFGKTKCTKHQGPSGIVENDGFQCMQVPPWFFPCDEKSDMVYISANSKTPTSTSPYEPDTISGQRIDYNHPNMDILSESEEEHCIVNSSQSQPSVQENNFPMIFMPYAMPRFSPVPMSPHVLHCDILEFAKRTRPTRERQLCIEAAIDHVRSCVKIVWPDADVEVFGSFATGLCLQHSDVDLAIVGIPMQPSLVNMSNTQASAILIQELAPFLKKKEWCKSYKVLATASVPVLKCYCAPVDRKSHPSVSVAVDITIGNIVNKNGEGDQQQHDSNSTNGFVSYKHGTQHTGSAAREYVLSKIQELPALAPLVLLLKSYLHHKGLSNVYLGGLGSFSLTLLVTYYLEKLNPFADGLNANETSSSADSSEISVSPKSSSADSSLSSDTEISNQSRGQYYVRRAADGIEKVLAYWQSCNRPLLSTLLLGFLGTVGLSMDLASVKVVLKGMDGTPGGLYYRENRHVALWIDDPLRPGVNVGAGSFAMCHVQAALREMWQVLTTPQLPVSGLSCSDPDCRDIGALQPLSHLSHLLIGETNYK